MSVGELITLVPQIDWRRYLSIVLARSINFSEPVIIFALQYIQDLVILLSKTQPRYILYLLYLATFFFYIKCGKNSSVNCNGIVILMFEINVNII